MCSPTKNPILFRILGKKKLDLKLYSLYYKILILDQNFRLWISLCDRRRFGSVKLFAKFDRPCELPSFNFNVVRILRFLSVYLGVPNTSMDVGREKSGNKAIKNASNKVFNFSLLRAPVVSFWDCIVRKMRYSFRPEWA